MKNADRPAHPVDCEWNNGNISGEVQTTNQSGFEMGLTKREMFAMAAMQGLCSNAYYMQKLGKFESVKGP